MSSNKFPLLMCVRSFLLSYFVVLRAADPVVPELILVLGPFDEDLLLNPQNQTWVPESFRKLQASIPAARSEVHRGTGP